MGARRAEEASRDGMLVENSEELLVPDDEVRVVANAYEVVGRLREILNEEISEEFYDWFRGEYGMGPELRKKRLWDELMR